jgi:tetratricopeptide (TPR) repeat protein
MNFWITPLLLISPPEVDTASQESQALVETHQRDAKTLFEEGSASYEAADYENAISKFTEALRLVRALPDAHEVELDILFNIASAHEKAFEVDNDLTHLRQALILLERYSEEKSDLGDSLDAEARIARLRKRLREEDPEANTEDSLAPQHTLPKSALLKKGVGFTVPGLSSMAIGIAVLAHGATFKVNAENQVSSSLNTLGIPMDHPAWDQSAKYIEQETRKGRALMGVGGAITVTGAVLTGFGINYLVKHKQAIQLSPAFSSTQMGIIIQGNF